MERDCFGICLNKALLSQHRRATFTHVRAYQTTASLEDDLDQDVVVSFSSPQMSGKEVLKVLKQSKHLLWRAGYLCPSHD